MYIVKYNGTQIQGEFSTREDAIDSVEKSLGTLDFNKFNIAFWPSISARGQIMIEIIEVN
jgi:hypothetical protein